MKTRVGLCDHVLQGTKAYAAVHGLTMREVIEEALRRHLSQVGSIAPRRGLGIRPLAGGGLAPGYEGRSWNEILGEVNKRSLPGDEDGAP